MALVRKEVSGFEVDEIEALVALRGLQIILHLGIPSLILECDSLSIIEAVNPGGSNHTTLGSLRFQVLWYKAAHLLARHAMLMEDTIQ